MSDVFKGTPYKFQLDGIKYALMHKYILNSSPMGAGKCLMAVVPALMAGGQTLIVCPSYLKRNWEREIHKWAKHPQKVLVITTSKHIKKISDEYSFVIMSYEMLKYLDYPFRNVIMDECQAIKNRTSLRSRNFFKYLRKHRARHFFALSGTPVTKNITDWFSILKILSLCPHGTNGIPMHMTFQEFADTFANVTVMNTRFFDKRIKAVRDLEIKKYSGVKNLEQLYTFLQDKYVQLSLEEANLPPLLIKHFYTEGKSTVEEEHSLSILSSMTSPTIPITTGKSMSAESKAEKTAAYVLELFDLHGGPIIVFSDHLKPIGIMEEIFKKKNLNFKIIQGSTPVDKRQAIVDDLQNEKIDGILATIGSTNTGYNMTKSCHAVVNDLSWDHATNQQCFKRLHRIGQNKLVTIHIHNSSPVDEKINNILLDKQEDLGRFYAF